jgi:hypothetical protein
MTAAASVPTPNGEEFDTVGVDKVLPGASTSAPTGLRPTAGISADVLSKLLDTKSTLRIPQFSGERHMWSDWRFRFETAVSLLGLETPMKEACGMSSEAPLLTGTGEGHGQQVALLVVDPHVPGQGPRTLACY